MIISVVGMGYVGLATAISLAKRHDSVYCIDKDKTRIDQIRICKPPFFEPGLDARLLACKNRLIPVVEGEEALRGSQAIFIAVETLFDGRKCDLSFVERAAMEIGCALKGVEGFKVIVVKSTVLPGTTLNLVKPTVLRYSEKPGSEFGFCMNPEFLREGCMLSDLDNPDRIVLGVDSRQTQDVMREVYGEPQGCEVVFTNAPTAEMIKYAANAYFALSISFANEMGRICEKLPQVDSEDVFRGILLDKRISPVVHGERVIPEWASYLKSGCGFGGSCFPKDVQALAAFEKDIGVAGGLLESVISVNKSQIEHVFKLGLDYFPGSPHAIGILGTAFKPDTDDVRESPGIQICRLAIKKGYAVLVHDERAFANTKRIFGEEIQYYSDPLEVMELADIIFVTTAWRSYLAITDSEFEGALRQRAVVIDCRSIFKDRPEKSWRKRVGVGEKGRSGAHGKSQLTQSALATP